MKNVVKYALINSFGTAAYVIAVAFFMNHFGDGGFGVKTVFIPIVMLMLFVFSAALTGSLVFGRPIMWYLDGKKKEALSLLVCTLGILLLIIIAAFFFLVLFIR